MTKYKVKSDYIALKKHSQKTDKGDIFERDIMTINPLEDLFTPGQDVINSDSNFKFSIRTDQDASKKHTKNSWLLTPEGEEQWKLSDVDSSPISDESEIRLKPDYSSLRDFAYYGSAVELVRAAVNHVIMYFPAELYFSGEEFTFAKLTVGDDEKTAYVVSNQFDISVDVDFIDASKVDNPYRYLCLHAGDYDVYKEGKIIATGTTKSSFSATSYTCGNGSLGTVSITGGGKTFNLTVYMYEGKKYVLYTDNSYTGYSIRPCDAIINEYFETIDDFERVLLNRKTNPVYKAVFETPYETETGNKYTMESYIWPSINNWNPLVEGMSFETYVNSLINLGSFHDEYDSNNLWRMLTHEAIKNLDWTFFRQNGDTVEDLSNIDSSKIEAFIQIYGRQFDGLKRYIDAIKGVNKVSYDEKNNIPNYLLTDVVELGGFDAILPNTTGKTDVLSNVLYSAQTEGYSEVDANNYFMRVLKINEHYLNSLKGTRFGIQTILRLLGIKEEEYKIKEYVAVAEGISATCIFNDELSFGDDFYPRPSASGVTYPSIKDVITINMNKSDKTYDEYDTYFDDIAVKPYRCVDKEKWKIDDEGNKTIPTYYAIPWYENGKHYEGDWYFQSKGGWGKTSKKDVFNPVIPKYGVYSGSTIVSECFSTYEEALEYYRNLSEKENYKIKICGNFSPLLFNEFENSGLTFMYDESESYLKFAENTKELKGFFKSEVKTGTICYVTDLTDWENYSADVHSHYFYLTNDEYIGLIVENEGNEGWKNILIEEIQEHSSIEAKKVLYLENIIETTEGNNPHISNGEYDDGIEYLEYMNKIFKYQLELGDDGLISFSDKDKQKINECYVFGISNNISDLKNDNRKCDYYYNPNNTSLLKESGSSSTLPKLDQGKISDVYTSADTVYGYASGLTVYSGTTYAFNPEQTSNYKNEEPAANSVINVKNVELIFAEYPTVNVEYNCPDVDGKKCIQDCWQEYITDVVMKYVKQMLPSTVVFKWYFGEANTPVSPQPSKKFYFDPSSKSVGADDDFARTTLVTDYSSYTINKPNGVTD